MITKDELDWALAQVTRPAPVIRVGPGFPIERFAGFDDPYPGWYRGVRVEVHPAMGEDCTVVEL